MTISVGLDIAVRALLTQQLGVDSTSHNIANVGTEGFSRQRVRMEAVPGVQTQTGGQGPGGGVIAVGVERVRDIFADQQYRLGAHTSGRLDARATSLQRAELALAEPTEFGLRAALSRYWNAWRDVATTPESTAARTALVETGGTLAFTAQRIHDSLLGLRGEANSELLQGVEEINSLTTEVLSLNQQIVAQEGISGEAPDLRDRRDLALDRLAQLMDIHAVEQDDGRVDVFVGGHSLVTANHAHEIYGDPNATNSNFVDLRFVDDNLAVNVGDGAVRGLLDQRDVDLPSRIADLNALVGQVITDVNALHAAGYGLDGATGRDFFSGSDASDIAIAAAVAADPNAVAAATAATGVPGDGANAQAIADLQYATPLGGGLRSYDAFYADFISELGSAVRETESLLDAQQLVNDHIQQVRDGTSGVSLDEEMVNLTRYQRAYQGAAQLVTVIDEMLATLIAM